MARPTLQNINPRDIFAHADRFHWAESSLRNASTSQLALKFAHPAMVLSAFASELYLKCIHCIDSGLVPPGHDIEKLFNGLPHLRRARITQIWDAKMVNDDAELQKHDRALGFKIPRDLPTALKDCSRGFEQLRYVYENPEDVKFYIVEFPRVLRPAILEIQPAWGP